MSAFLNTGEIHSPLFVFVRNESTPADSRILDALGHGSYQLAELDDPGHRPYVVIGHTSEWTMVADDWSYTLWQAEPQAKAIEALARRAKEAFVCRWPDVDDTFAFSLWRDGDCVRSYELIQEGWTGPVRLEESGVPLPIETEDIAVKSADERLRAICGALGYVADDAVGTFRMYAGTRYVRDIGPYGSAFTSISQEQWERRRQESIDEQLASGAVWKQ